VKQKIQRDWATVTTTVKTQRHRGQTADNTATGRRLPRLQVTQPFRDWQRPEAGFRTDASAPLKTGLQYRLETRLSRCQKDSRNFAEAPGPNVAAQGPTARVLPMPIILSANIERHSSYLPCLLLGGDDNWVRRILRHRTSLRSVRTIPPQTYNQSSFGGTRLTLSGAAGVD